MSPTLSDVFGELGILQYLDVFVDQGFDTWETILDITESDLESLGVKLGHRRKLQRRIANARGIAPNAVLVSPTRPSVEDAVRSETQQRSDVSTPTLTSSESRDSATTTNGGPPVTQKRKYRRHPKVDDKAPERPPSAYVLFSNKMREDLKGQNLTFTEIAKLVGENWQGLTHEEKEPFERRAQTAKEKYIHDLAEYKKTDAYKEYLEYLQDFKAKHGNQSQDKEGSSKRARLSNSSSFETHGASQPLANRGVEAPTRQHRIGSIVSNGDSYYAPSVMSSSQRTPPGEDSMTAAVTSPNGSYFDRRRDRSPTFATSPRDKSGHAPFSLRKEPSYLEVSRGVNSSNGNEAAAVAPPPCHLPPLSDMLTHSIEGAPAPAPAGPNFGVLPRGHQTHSPAPTSSISGSESRPPSLRKEQSSAGSSIGSGSSHSSYPRTPIEGPLPIHALLTGAGGKVFGNGTSPIIYRSLSPDDRTPSSVLSPPERSPSDPVVVNGGPYYQSNGHHPPPPPPPPPTQQQQQHHAPYPQFAYSDHRLAPLATASLPSRPSGKGGETGLDGISALLQADRLADRRLE